MPVVSWYHHQLENNVFSHIVCCVPYFFLKYYYSYKKIEIIFLLAINSLDHNLYEEKAEAREREQRNADY